MPLPDQKVREDELETRMERRRGSSLDPHEDFNLGSRLPNAKLAVQPADLTQYNDRFSTHRSKWPQKDHLPIDMRLVSGSANFRETSQVFNETVVDTIGLGILGCFSGDALLDHTWVSETTVVFSHGRMNGKAE